MMSLTKALIPSTNPFTNLIPDLIGSITRFTALSTACRLKMSSPSAGYIPQKVKYSSGVGSQEGEPYKPMRGNHASVPARLAFARLAFARLVSSKKLKQVNMPTLNKLA